MSIDALLTSSGARERIGDIVRYDPACFFLDRDRRWVELAQERRPISISEGTLEHELPQYEFRWTFKRTPVDAFGYGHMRSLELARRHIEKGNVFEAVYVVRKAMRETFLPRIISLYDAQLSRRMEKQRGLPSDSLEGYIFQDSPGLSPDAMLVVEGLNNAVEHGSDFGRKGYVKLHFSGGEKGALFLKTLRQKSPRFGVGDEWRNNISSFCYL